MRQNRCRAAVKAAVEVEVEVKVELHPSHNALAMALPRCHLMSRPFLILRTLLSPGTASAGLMVLSNALVQVRQPRRAKVGAWPLVRDANDVDAGVYPAAQQVFALRGGRKGSTRIDDQPCRGA